jgi:broad specificity phosphatase PhoE
VLDSLDLNEIMPPDDSLGITQDGEIEARRIAEVLGSCKLGRIGLFCGPRGRSRLQAEIIASSLGVESIVSESLDDRVVFSEGEEISIEEFRARQERGFLDPMKGASSDIESPLCHRLRVEAWLASMHAGVACETLIVIGHGATIEHLHSSLSGKPSMAMSHTFSYCAPSNCHLWRSIELPDERKIWCCVGSNVSITRDEEFFEKFDICADISVLTAQLASDPAFAALRDSGEAMVGSGPASYIR